MPTISESSRSTTDFGSEPTRPPASVAEQESKWYRRDAGNSKQRWISHPYAIHSIIHQGDSLTSDLDRYDDVKFWPFVGALKPWKRPDGLDQWKWDEFEDTVAFCGLDKLVIGKCADNQPWRVILDMCFEDDTLYTLAWTYHPFTCHPLIAVAGANALIYIIDIITKRCIRTLKGHGDEILCLAFAPLNPHILASTSSDRTTRIWNILGSDAPAPPPGDLPNENYPMADADEGNVIVAVLAGEGKGGHRAYVVSCAFHPTKRAIATCGMDYTAKIWPLPPFPDPSPVPIPTPLGYRPMIVYFPLFSTSRLHYGFLDWIEWVADDILIIRGDKVMVTWQWLSYSRYFREDEYAPLSMEPASYSDYSDSGSFMVVSRVNTLTDMWFRHPHLHRGFHPTPADLARFPNSINMVTDPLLACPHQMDPREMTKHWYPEVRLYNLLLARDGRPPRPITELRPYKPEVYDMSVDLEEEENRDGSKVRKKSSTPQASKRKYITFPEEKSETSSAMGSAHNSLLVPWRLRPTTSPWPKKREPWLGPQYRTGICNVTISPRGARWIVGVGEGMSIFIWRMKD
ncbi:polycomb protein EED [Cryptococcus deuterogattii 99/473]|uniref:Polycomb protein EED n=1 Tax=Cryptococcus deuterogattii Ram5 TaxID=1296110 RepID=A0A0D0TUB2_9TREE|nr:polycomb protein EED [Cryptococcus deuterogattii Ram5]KIY59093.1 polycomb protein EED [Cryptococcus deuterogattii 99/473]